MHRCLSTLLAFSVAPLLLSACGGGATTTTISISPTQAYRIADETVRTARLSTPEPGADDLHAAFDEVVKSAALPTYWHLVDMAPSMLEVQLWIPAAPSSSAADTTAAEGSTATSEESAAGTTVSEAPAETPETTSTGTTMEEGAHAAANPPAGEQEVKLRSCIKSVEGEWEASPEACESDGEGSGSHSTETGDAGHTPTTAGGTTATTAPGSHAHWTYEGSEGPDHWADLDPSYVLCADGSAQTPIDIKDPVSMGLDDPVLRYTIGTGKVVNNGHTIQMNAPEGNHLEVDGKRFDLAQLHFHAPSEHTINGVHSPVEVHFVHKSADGELAVLGVMLVRGAQENVAWKPYVDALDTAEGAETATEVDWAAMLPSDLVTIRYSGSLTTPPCSEGVRWMLMNQPVSVSESQIRSFEQAYDGNNRPLQPTNGRTVLIDATRG